MDLAAAENTALMAQQQCDQLRRHEEQLSALRESSLAQQRAARLRVEAALAANASQASQLEGMWQPR